ncbi:MAG: hypothetical protein A2281_11245 [Bacteroidetes bacterium RIFOXYA12_FULL_38_20]|nr:MAG: hypothetical protein UR43_C0018G0010 [candidate division TM6 bacterium GW2011_GWF2_33_332]OFY80862.1 MAG: hypothetical protein A2281_11245 [Bacteroidetes bacterium RIFOXYA12_FULL_38_20]
MKNRLIKIVVLLSRIIIIPFVLSVIFLIIASKQTGKINITENSLKKIEYINSELIKLKSLNENIFENEDELIFKIKSIIKPEVFNEFSFLNDYIYKRTYSINYVFRYNRFIKKYPEYEFNESLKNISKNKFQNIDTINYLIDSLLNPKENIYILNFVDDESFNGFVIKSINELIISDSVLNCLRNFEGNSFENFEEFGQKIKESIGYRNFEIYHLFIESVIEDKPAWIKNTWYYILITFIVLIILVITENVLINVGKSKNEALNLDEEISEKKEELIKNPEKINLKWDLANLTLQKYYNKNLIQVNNIYWISVISMIIGFLLITCILLLSILGGIDFKITEIGIIAGIITEFIGATFLFIYKSTINQALKYTRSLDEINKVGISIDIIQSIEASEINRDKIENAKIDISKILISKIDK